MSTPVNHPFSLKQTTADLKANLAAMEEEEAAELRQKQECEEKKKRLAELAKAKQVEEVAAAAEAV